MTSLKEASSFPPKPSSGTAWHAAVEQMLKPQKAISIAVNPTSASTTASRLLNSSVLSIAYSALRRNGAHDAQRRMRKAVGLEVSIAVGGSGLGRAVIPIAAPDHSARAVAQIPRTAVARRAVVARV